METNEKAPKLGELEWAVEKFSPRPSPNGKHLMPAKMDGDPDQNEYDRIYVINRI